EVCPVRNDFFGETVTVSGLVTGGDIIKQYKGKLKKNVIIPKTMLREFSGVFLDEVTLCELEKTLDVRVHVAEGGDGFIRILGGER
ncbi:MAG TPA: radical SAM protein, partial [Clostridiales bacterium]|nr:radical SAM protein [Clostridiales bacterium]